MKKQMKTLIIGLAAVIVLVGVLLVVMNLPEQETESSSSSTVSASSTTVDLLKLSLDDLQTVEVKNTQEYTMVRVPNTENEWIIKELEGLPKTKNSYAMLALAMCSLKAQKLVDAAPADLAQYGLQEPVSTVTAVMKDGSRHTVEVGNAAPGGGGYTYLKMKDSPEVYVVNTSDVRRMFQVKSDYISTEIFTWTDTSTEPSVGNCTFGGTSRPEELVIEKTEKSDGSGNDSRVGYSSHMIISPRKRDTNTNVFSEVSQSVFYTTVSEVVAYNVQENQWAEYGLDNPYSTMTMSYTEGDKAYTLNYRASEMDGEGNFYLALEGVPVVYRAYFADSFTYTWHNVQYANMASRLFVLPFINDLASVTVTTPEDSYRFDLTLVDAGTDDEKLNIHYGSKAINDKIFKKFYQIIIGPTSEHMVEDPEAIVLGDPLLTCTYTYLDSSRAADVVSFYKGPARQVYVSVNGEVEFTTRDAFIDKVYGDIPKVLENIEIITDY